ncbi:efflux RND transporter permease subunit, partial [Sutterella sp.]|uniref:efflux RND transporter permease subunit n=1 Tax=Sutterella sp. TaxID=1981025 RepID=UPI003FD8D8B1
MIEKIIRASVANRMLVLLAALLLAFAGVLTILRTPVDALPDLSDVQVIVKTDYTGQAPQIVEDQVTYPISTTMLSVPGATTVRGFSLFGTSYVYVLFEDGTDLYWARSRVLESLSGISGKLPSGVTPELGPDATGVGWIYEYALVDRSGREDLESLRSLQDWFLKYELKTIPDPVTLAQRGLTIGDVKSALSRSNQEAGGGSVELSEAEFMVTAHGYLKTLDDFRQIVLKADAAGTPVLLGDVAQVRVGPEMRRGIAELNGEGEVAGGVVIIRSGGNARDVIAKVKARIEELKPSLPYVETS